MNTALLEKIERKCPPFNGNVLKVNMNGEKISLKILREVIGTIFLYLGKSGLQGKLFKCDDWLQHDGLLFDGDRYTYKKLKQTLKNNNTFYNSRHEDHLVRKGYYDSQNRWYVRVYIADKNDLKLGEDLYGDFDISISDYHILKLKEIIENKYSIKLNIEDAYTYFRRINVEYRD